MKKGSILFVFLLALLQGCSTQFTYNRLDWLISWYMRDYIDFDREQKVLFRQRLEPLLEWHRYEELDEYIRVLNGIEGDLDNPITEVEVGAWMDDATAAARRIEVRMLSLMLDIGTDIDDRQIANFTNKLLESQEKYRKEYLQRDDEEYRQENFKSLSKNLRRFMGKLETTQKKALRETMQDMQRFDAIWLEDRQRWLDALAFHLQRKPGWQNEILLAHQRREDTRSEEYRETYAHNTGVLKKAISNIINSRSEAQDERMRKEINALKEDFEALSSEKTPVSWYEEPAVRYRL